jgi:hypothetical protein
MATQEVGQMTDLTEILKILDVIIQLEKKVEVAIAAEKDTNKREAISKACKERDVKKLRELILGRQ